MKAKRQPKSLSDVLGDESDDVNSWVKKSRELELQKKQKQKELSLAKQRESLLKEQDEKFSYTEDDIQGLKVKHDLKKLDAGQSIILTLRDSKIIKDMDVNDENDELENLNLRELDKAKKNIELRKKKPVYSAVDEFNSEKKEILPQYNEEEPEPTYTLGNEDGPSKQDVLDAIRRKLNINKHDDKAVTDSTGRVAYDLNSKLTLASEYYTQEEITSFRKASGKEKKLRKKKKKEKLTDMLIEPVDGSSADHGSRDDHKKEDKKETEKQKRLQNYERAVEKAIEQAGSLKKLDREIEDPEEKILNNIENAQRFREQIGINVADTVLSTIEQRKQEEEEEKQQKENSIVFTSTSEFCRRLNPTSFDANKQAKVSSVLSSKLQTEEDPDEEDAYELEQNLKQQLLNKQQQLLNAPAPAPAPAPQQQQGGFWVEESPGKPNNESTTDTHMETEEDGEVDSKGAILEEEPLVCNGLAATIKLLQQKNMKGGSSGYFRDPLETYGGRKNDKPLVFSEGEDPSPFIRLEHRDEFGRIMTPKEAFRKLSWIFHGKDPGKNKQEKKIRQYKEELVRKQMSSIDTPLKTVQALQQKQQQLKSPYIILSGLGANSSLSNNSSFSAQSRPTSGLESSNQFKDIKDEDLAKPSQPFGNGKKVGFGLQNKRKGNFGNSNPKKLPKSNS